MLSVIPPYAALHSEFEITWWCSGDDEGDGDDVFGVWICDEDPITDARKWRQFQRHLNRWHQLEWIVSERTTEVVFLDLTLQLVDDRIHSCIYEKENNLHLYIPAKSAHPPGVLFGIISGSVYRAFSLCSDTADAQSYLRKLWRHLIARGYSPLTLRPLFAKAFTSNTDRAPRTERPPGPPEHLLFKLTYHPQDPSSHLIQNTWKGFVAEPPLSKPLKDVDNNFKPFGHC